jgi:hypothetical protein
VLANLRRSSLTGRVRGSRRFEAGERAQYELTRQDFRKLAWFGQVIAATESAVGRATFSKRAPSIDTEVIGGDSGRFGVDVSTGTQRLWLSWLAPTTR